MRDDTASKVPTSHSIGHYICGRPLPGLWGGREPQMECSEGRPAPTLLKAETNIIRQQWWGFIDAVSTTYWGTLLDQ